MGVLDFLGRSRPPETPKPALGLRFRRFSGVTKYSHILIHIQGQEIDYKSRPNEYKRIYYFFDITISSHAACGVLKMFPKGSVTLGTKGGVVGNEGVGYHGVVKNLQPERGRFK